MNRAEIRRRAREELNKSSSNTWKYVLGIIILAIVGFIFLVRLPVRQIQGEAIPIMGREHIDIGASHQPYNSNPPTSGPHYEEEANWGVYENPLPDEQLVHNLEHGGIWISYKDIDSDTKAKLKSISKQYPGSVIIAPRLQNDSKIVLASWGRLEKLGQFDENKIVDFIRSNKNNSPEPIAQ